MPKKIFVPAGWSVEANMAHLLIGIGGPSRNDALAGTPRDGRYYALLAPQQ
jgi:hypothetical protein